MKYLSTTLVMISASYFVSACSAPKTDSPLSEFQTHLQSLCGKTFEGRVTSEDPQDEEWRREVLTLGTVSCPDERTTILPLAVGTDKSRVWTLTLDAAGQSLDFRHAHTLKDGSPDPVTGYGGVATSENSKTAQPYMRSFLSMNFRNRISQKTACKHL